MVYRGLAVLFLAAGFLTIWSAPAVAESGSYLGPVALVASPDGSRLFVANADRRQIAVVDLRRGKTAGAIDMPAEPTGLALNRAGTTLYVTCAAPQSMVCVVDTAAMAIKRSLPAGHTAIGPSLSPDGKRLYVCNRFENNVTVIDLDSGRELTRVSATREPYFSAVTPDGATVFVINHLPNDRADGVSAAAVISLIDAATYAVSSIRLLNGSTGLRGICVSPDGRYVFVTHILARYQLPATHLERGWMNTNALTILDAPARKLLNTVPLDDVDLGAAMPWGVACTADGRTLCVTHAGTGELSVIDLPGVLRRLANIPADEETSRQQHSEVNSGGHPSFTQADVPDDFAFLVGLRRRVKLGGSGSRGVAIAAGKAYVAQYFADELGVVDLATQSGRPASRVALGATPQLTVARRGELLFNDATICLQHWQACASCHPDARMDALNWDLTNDGLGNTKSSKSMLLAHQTPPSMWASVRRDAESAVRSGMTHILSATRPEEEAASIDAYLKSLRPVPSPHLVRGKLSAVAKRGKALFVSKEVGCSKCHPAPLYTDLKMYDVASQNPYDRHSNFDTPTLIEAWRTAPYLHDGHYPTIKELIVEGQHGKTGGNLDRLTPQQIDDLVEFVLSL